MTTNDTATPVLESRVERLERQLRWSWLATAAVAAFAVITILIPKPQQPLENKDLPRFPRVESLVADYITADKIYAKALSITGPDGNARIFMGAGSDGSWGQVFYNPSQPQKAQIWTYVQPDGSCSQVFADRSEKKHAVICLHPDGCMDQYFYDSFGKCRILIEADSHGGQVLGGYDSNDHAHNLLP